MPPKRSNIGRQSRRTRNRASQRANETDTQRTQRTTTNRERTALSRSRSIQPTARPRSRNTIQLNRAAFAYDSHIDYASHSSVIIGNMDKVCQYCRAFKFNNETPGMCCFNGKVRLPPLNTPHEPLASLLCSNTPQSRHFLSNIQSYNSCFQMTSFGATNIISDNFMPTYKVHSPFGLSICIPASISTTDVANLYTSEHSPHKSFPPQIQGQVYHRAGSLLPLPDAQFQFLQIYFIGNAEDEVNQRCTINTSVRRSIVAELQNIMHEHNDLVKLFTTALERMPSDNHRLVIRADKTPVGEHARRFNAPTIDDVAIVIVGEDFPSRDIVLHRRNSQLHRVSELHRSYDALQYPILFSHGEDGYHINIKMVNPTTGINYKKKFIYYFLNFYIISGCELEKKVSAMNYYAYRFMLRENTDNHLLKCRRLFHQFAVDMYAKIETERLNYIRFNQTKLRSEEYIHLRDAINSDGNANDIGRITILPSSYTGSPRHMQEYAQDAMTYVRHYGRPDMFITFTCNPKWTDITENLLHGQTSIDRHDIIARVFRRKIKSMMDFIVKYHVFGETRCWMYSIEWQKRGLPHAHILIWMVTKIMPNEVDDIISAEIPDENNDPVLHDIITTNMIHGPCGPMNVNSPCMVDGRCCKRYPRQLISDTVTGIDGYPLYRRRSPEDGGGTALIRMHNEDIQIDNRWVVPYSPLLCKTFKAHINVEYCNSVKSIKYICKYVNKGSDMAVFQVIAQNPHDEITQYQMGRYVSSNEAFWRIFAFTIHDRHPTVVHLAVHLENGQRVYFTNANAANIAAQPPNTTLMAFFTLCQTDDFARTLLYAEVPSYYTWNQSSKTFQRRKQGKAVVGHPHIFVSDALGRIYSVHPNNAECFYLRLLLINVRGPTSFVHLRTVDGQVCPTYREACQRLHLLEDDIHWESTIADACASSTPNQIRMLFAIILTSCSPSNPLELWNKYRSNMAEDILYRMRQIAADPEMPISDQMYNETLILLEDMCFAISTKALIQLGLPSPNRTIHNIIDCELRREQQYNINDLNDFVQLNQPQLNPQQRQIFDTIINAINDEQSGVFFLDAPGGTGKTFVISLLLATIRAKTQVVLALASSGIAATLLDGGRTAHSALKLPLNIHTAGTSVCNISRGSSMAKVLQSCKLIIWDECTMAHKHSLEALDRTLRDIRNNQHLFGGALVLLAGDFRQTLPVIPRSTAADEVNACLKSSYLWRYIKILRLTTNVRVQLQNDPTAIEFSKQLLDIGNGKIPIDNQTGCITLPDTFCTIVDTKQQLIDNVYPNIRQNHKNHVWLNERAVLASKNTNVNELNSTLLTYIPGELSTFDSVDTVINQDEVVNYPTEFLNSLNLPGIPPHRLQLKVGAPIIMLRNINQPKLCNGTRLAVKKLFRNVIEATILSGKFKGEDVLIPRIPLIPTDLPFQFKRLQFPVNLAFAITINKAQGQSLSVCGIDLEQPCFSHGQLYVACSRVGKPSDLFIYMPDKQTKNIVYPKALE